MTHLMLDLETLGTSSKAPVIQVGLVAFNNSYEILDKLNVRVRPLSLEHADIDTICWWFDQSKEVISNAKKSLIAGVKPLIACQKIIDFVSIYLDEDSLCWAHGVSFDFPITNNMLADNNFETPFPFWSIRDTRTVFDLMNYNYKVERDKIIEDMSLTAHDAVDDCIIQIKMLENSLVDSLSYENTNT